MRVGRKAALPRPAALCPKGGSWRGWWGCCGFRVEQRGGVVKGSLSGHRAAGTKAATFAKQSPPPASTGAPSSQSCLSTALHDSGPLEWKGSSSPHALEKPRPGFSQPAGDAGGEARVGEQAGLPLGGTQ